MLLNLIRNFLIISQLSILLGCVAEDQKESSSSDQLSVDQPAIISGDWYRPEPEVSWFWQLEGQIGKSIDVEIYDIDLFDTSKQFIAELQTEGKKVICYFSAGSYENWRADKEKFSNTVLGNELDGWPGELWLDIRQQNVHQIMQERLDLAVAKGCDGVEPDNMDGYQNNPGFELTAQDQLAFNRFIANQAHKRQLSVGLKNDLDQIKELVDYFDFAVNEQCFEYQECELLLPFINANKAVLNAEYKEEYRQNTELICPQAMQLKLSSLILPLDLDGSFRISCQ